MGHSGRVVTGGRNNSNSHSILQTSHNIFGRPNDHFTANINIDFINQSTGITPDINLLVAGTTDGCIFTDTTLNISSGKVARILGGSIGSNTIIFDGYPLNLFVGSTTMNITGGDITEIFGTSLGRWTNEIYYFGDIQINISGGIIRSEIYGAGAASLTGNNPDNQYQYYNSYCSGVTTSTEINISGGTLQGNVYGGGYGYSNYLTTDVRADGGALYGNSTINITGGTINGDIFGAGRGYNYSDKTYLAEMKGNSTINISGNPTITGNIYGAGEGISGMNLMARLVGSSTINIDADLNSTVYGGGSIARVTGNTNIVVDGGTSTGTIFAGGSHGDINGNSSVIVNDGTVNEIYAGGDLATINNTSVIINGGEIGLAYAGGNQANVNDTSFVVNGGEVTLAYAGGNRGVARNTSVEIKDGTIGTLYCGGNHATVTKTELEVSGGNSTTIYGGGNEASVGTSEISVTGGAVTDMYGGGNNAGVTTTAINVEDGTVGRLFGGSNNSGAVTETTIIIEGGTITETYGGNNAGGSTTDTNVYICGGELGNVYGGGNNVFVQNTNVYLRNTDEQAGSIYGGGNNAGADVTKVYLQGGDAENVFGGSNNGGTVRESHIMSGDESDIQNPNPEPEPEPEPEPMPEPRTGYVAYSNGTYYSTLQTAIDSTGSSETKIIMVDNSTETINIASGKNIVIELNGYTLTSTNTTITLRGNLTIDDSSENSTGAISTTAGSNSYYPILQYGGNLIVNNGAISSNYRGIRTYENAHVIINGGNVTARSGAGIGFEDDGSFEMHGGTVTASSHAIYTDRNVNMTITGGTVIGNSTGVHNSGNGTIIIGVQDGSVEENPIILGRSGLNGTAATINFYDGIIGGTNTAINGTISEIEESSTRQTGTRTFNNTNYNITYLNGPSGGQNDNPDDPPDDPDDPTITIPGTVADSLNIENVYGGNNTGGQTTTTNIDCYYGNIDNIYGGGNRVNSPTTNVNIYGGDLGSVYGGSNQTGNVTTANLNIEGGQIDNAYGGNNAGGTTSNATVIVDGGTVGNVYGGNNQGGITTNAYTEANHGTITNIYGGGDRAITNSATLNVNSANILGSVYGGGNHAAVNTDTNLNLNNASISTNVYGGGNEGVVLGNTYAKITNSSIDGSIYAGGNGVTAIVSGNTNLLIEGTTNIEGHAFGGGNQAATGTENSNNSSSIVNIVGGTIGGNVYGGANTSVVYGVTNVNIGKSVPNIQNMVQGDIDIKGTVFGGGEANAAGDENYDFSFISVTNGININIDADTYSKFLIGKSIFGSGNASTTTGTSIINIHNYGTPEHPKSNISIQRANTVTLDNCAIWLAGATDRTNEHSNVLFSLSRIDELKVKNNTTLYMQNGANLLKKFSSLVDVGNNEVKGFVTIDSNGNITKNVDNRLYIREGVNINIAENEQANVYGDVSGMFFLGLYTGKNHLSLGIYSPSYENGEEIDLSDKMVFTRNSYVMGEHYSDHDITVDGFYTNYKTEDDKIKVDYINPTPEDQLYYIWNVGENADAIIYEIQLTASKFNTLGTKELPLIGLETPNTIFEYSGTVCDLVDGVELIDKSQIKNIEDNQDDADNKFGLGIETGRNGWSMEGKTKFMSNDPYYSGTTVYTSENSNSTPILNFYLYHSQNLSIQRELGTVVIAFTAIRQIDDLNKEMKNVLIYVNMDTALYQDWYYESAITPGEKYELFTNTQTSITKDSEFSQYYSLMLEDFSQTDYYDNYMTNYRTLVSSTVLPANTTITMIDLLTDSTEYYYYIVTQEDENNRKKKFDITDFKKMGSTDEYFNEDNTKYYDSTLDVEHEEFIFHYDFANTNLQTPIVDQTIFLEYRDQDDETLMGVLGDLRETLEYSVYITGSNIDVTATASSPSVYLGKDLYLNVTTNYNQAAIDGKIVYDTNYFGQKLGLKITFYDHNGDQVTGASLLGVYFELNGKKYYPRTDGTTRLNTADAVSNVLSHIKVVTENSNLMSGDYTIKIEAFSSADGVYYGLESADETTVNLLILSSIYGLDVSLPDTMVIVNGETGFNQDRTHDLNFNITYASGVISPNIKVGLYRRDYTNVYSNSYNLVDLHDYVTNELTTTDINDIYLVTDNPSSNFVFNLKLKNNLVTGTYRVVFSLYDGDIFIGDVYQYIVIN